MISTQTRSSVRLPASVGKFFDAIGPTIYADQTSETAPNYRLITTFCFTASISLVLGALAQGAGRADKPTLALLYFWVGISLLVIPLIWRIASQFIGRSERLFLILLLTEGLYLFRRLYSPTRFTGYDEMLHWITADDILYRHNLFWENTLLPVSPFYPAIEIITTAFANLTGTSAFPASILVLAIMRGLFITGLFLFYEKISGSTRIAAIACLVYMSVPTFVSFETLFSYESLGVVFAVLILWSETNAHNGMRSRIILFALLASIAITHHLSAIFCAVYLTGLVAVESIRRNTTQSWATTSIVAGSLGFIVLWFALPNNPVSDYIYLAFSRQVNALLNVLSGHSEAHIPFVSHNGRSQPLWLKSTAFASIFLVSICLATGFFRGLTWKVPGTGLRRFLPLLRREWPNSRMIIITIGALGFPVSVIFKLSDGWEVGDRMGTWAFISVGLVVAIGIVHYWQSRVWWNYIWTTVVLATIVMGGMIVGFGNHSIRGTYTVIADEASIEPMGINAASWTKEWLGPGNNFAADRDNQLLLGTYGDQRIVNSLSEGIDVYYPFLSKSIDKTTLSTIRFGRVDYLEVDLRITTDIPELAAYFIMGETGNGMKPPLPETLLKFDKEPLVSRVFDNGTIVIYDVRKLRQ